jgi:hypothetical protein
VDGLVLIVPETSAAASFFRALPSDLPVVAVESALPQITSVAVDQVLGARLLTDYLLSLGHETVHHVRGPSDWSEANGRVEGWLSALEERGRVVPKSLSGLGARSGYLAGQRLAETTRVSAVFWPTTRWLGVLRAFHEAGVRVRRTSAWSASTTSRGGLHDPPLAGASRSASGPAQHEALVPTSVRGAAGRPSSRRTIVRQSAGAPGGRRAPTGMASARLAGRRLDKPAVGDVVEA